MNCSSCVNHRSCLIFQWGGGGVKWHFKIWSPTWLETSNLPTFNFGRGGGKVASWNLKSNLTWTFPICPIFTFRVGVALWKSEVQLNSFFAHGQHRMLHSSLLSETNKPNRDNRSTGENFHAEFFYLFYSWTQFPPSVMTPQVRSPFYDLTLHHSLKCFFLKLFITRFYT